MIVVFSNPPQSENRDESFSGLNTQYMNPGKLLARRPAAFSVYIQNNEYIHNVFPRDRPPDKA